ncbi:MAG: type II toxin-antitoxin system death-on-curing family toxin [Patescibacteria group bacterium]|nr:type II toxin-antitoxin system death-on-curing family toxin [Patescibacteria group bacterium]
MAVRKVTVEHVRYVAHVLAMKTMGWSEPIPEFETRFPNVLESCVMTPFQRYAKQDLYKGLSGKAGALFYFMIKNHPFQNGNKRIAVTTLLVFLDLNGKWVKADKEELYRFAKWVAASPAEVKDEVIRSVEGFVRRRLVGDNE